jgi:superkiller protein 3
LLLWVGLLGGPVGSEAASGPIHLQFIRLESREEAMSVAARVQSEKNFDELAERYAPEGLKERLGYLGPVEVSKLSPGIGRALSRLQLGETTEPLAVEGAFFIFRRLGPEVLPTYEQTGETAAAHVDRGLVLGEIGDEAGEVEAYRRAIAMAPDFKEAYVNLGEALRRKALRLVESKKGAAGYPDRVLEAASDLLDEAIDQFKMALRIDPDMWEAHYDLGLAYAAEGLLDLTVLEFQEAVKLNPDSGDLQKSMALVLFLKGEVEQARAFAQRAGELGADVEDLRGRIEKEMKGSAVPPRPKTR